MIHADFEALEESCTFIESLSLDVEDARLALARGFQSPAEHGGIACLSNILDFLDQGSYSPLWEDSPELKKMEKSLDICKAALIKCVVEVAGEEGNISVLWDETTTGGSFVCKMVEWIKAFVGPADATNGREAAREDLAICATLSLGNLTREGAPSS